MTSSVKTRPKFHIVEGNTQTEFDDIYDDFKADYLTADVTVKDMLKKYDLSYNTYNRLRKIVAEETGVNRKMSKTKYIRSWTHHSRYIDRMKHNEKFRVSKYVNGKKTHFGVYDDMETAVYVRDKLEANNWSQETYKEIRQELFGEVEESERIENIFDDFKKDYLNGESIKYLITKYHISRITYGTLSKRICSEEGIDRKPMIHYRVRKKHERDLYRQQRM